MKCAALLAALLCASLAAMPAEKPDAVEPPFGVPFSVSRAGAAGVSVFRVPEAGDYAISLQHGYTRNDPADRSRVWKIAGGSSSDGTGKRQEPGAPLKIRLRISPAGTDAASPLLDRTVEGPRLSSWGADRLTARLAIVSLPVGTYVLHAENLADAPAFEAVGTSLSVAKAYRGK